MKTIKLPVVHAPVVDNGLRLDAALAQRWLTNFLRDEMIGRRGKRVAIIGVSGGVDSAVVAYLCAQALGAENVYGVRLPYRTSSSESFVHGGRVIEATGIHDRVVDISEAVDGYLHQEPEASARRRGNVMARVRMIALFDQSAKFDGLPIGTGNKSERMLGYFTWHADDSPPINPIGDLFKTQVWALARHLGVPQEIVDKPATADLIRGQTDEEDLGISYERADRILNQLLLGYRPDDIAATGFTAHEVELVTRRVNATHWKRHLPTTAVISSTAINEYYLRPVDY
ncbi:MAG: NAD+ synthase [Candidatus Eremiobacteraeota bacterium]|nr:NAD+ synthase [Candidatus Eremiobacteraeota bacterium]